jgi:hypothetical protein
MLYSGCVQGEGGLVGQGEDPDGWKEPAAADRRFEGKFLPAPGACTINITNP